MAQAIYYKDVMREIEWILCGQSPDWGRIERAIYAVLDTNKYRGLSARQLAKIVIERVNTTTRRLSHDTGAVDWIGL